MGIVTSRVSVDHAPLERSRLPAEKRVPIPLWNTKDRLDWGELGRFVN